MRAIHNQEIFLPMTNEKFEMENGNGKWKWFVPH